MSSLNFFFNSNNSSQNSVKLFERIQQFEGAISQCVPRFGRKSWNKNQVFSSHLLTYLAGTLNERYIEWFYKKGKHWSLYGHFSTPQKFNLKKQSWPSFFQLRSVFILPSENQPMRCTELQLKHSRRVIDLVTVFDAILTSRPTRKKLECLHENQILNNFRRTAVLKKYDL